MLCLKGFLSVATADSNSRVASKGPICYLHFMKVYLSGPMTGSADQAILGWRERAEKLLSPHAQVIDPASLPYNASLAYMLSEEPRDALARQMHGRLVVDRNKKLIGSVDVVLVNFLGSQRASIGSIGEVFWADTYGVPIVVVREASGNVHNHAMINALASNIATTLEDGCTAVLNILGNATTFEVRNA